MKESVDISFLEEHADEAKRLTPWRWTRDASSGKPYFFHVVTKESSWVKPKELEYVEAQIRSLDEDVVPPPPPPRQTTSTLGSFSSLNLGGRDSEEYQYGHVEDENDLAGYCAALAEGFIVEKEGIVKWLESFDRENMRVLRDPLGTVVGGLVGVPTGLMFSGKFVPCVGFSGVAVGLSGRGSGFGGRVVAQYISEVGAPDVSAAVPIACLYPSVPDFYRKLGFEVAGSMWEVEFDMSTLCLALAKYPRPADMRVRPLDMDRDMPQVEALHRQNVSIHNGGLDRSGCRLFWSNARQQRGRLQNGYVVEVIDSENSNSAIEGYMYFRQERVDGGGLEATIHVQDMVVASPRASLALLQYIASNRALVNKVHMYCYAAHPWSLLIPGWSPRLYHEYMVRILHVAEALRQRAYPAHVTARADIKVTSDRLLDHNNGVFRLVVEGGQVKQCERLQEVSEEAVEMDVLALGTMYTGYLSATQLATVGRVKGHKAHISALTTIFGTDPGGAPWTAEMF